MSTELYPDLTAPDVVIEATQLLFPFIDGVVVVESTDQGDII